jgi:hypothetical protein
MKDIYKCQLKRNEGKLREKWGSEEINIKEIPQQDGER